MSHFRWPNAGELVHYVVGPGVEVCAFIWASHDVATLDLHVALGHPAGRRPTFTVEDTLAWIGRAPYSPTDHRPGTWHWPDEIGEPDVA